jgi:hypothetical protein
MADYFSLLAGRTLGQTPALRPLVASRYGKERWSAEEPAVEYKSIERVAASRPAAPAPLDIPSRQFDLEVRETNPALTSPKSVERTREAESRENVIRREALLEPAVASPRNEPPDLTIRHPAVQPMSERSAQQEWRLLPLATNLDRAEFAAHSHNQQPRAIELRTSQKESSPEAPVVHVTIGRIDVRAVTPQVETSKPQPRATRRSSLDNYLRARNGERG